MFEIITVDELLKRLDKYSHKELHVHHTWKPSHKDFNGSNGLQLQENMRNYHVNTLGWQDIGQHVTLLPNGLFVTGRDFGQTPASIQGFNTGGFACEMLGNFDIGNDILEGEQKKSILKLAKYFNDKNRYIRFHRENAPKTCPGTSIDKAVFMNEVINYKEEDVMKKIVVYYGDADVFAAVIVAQKNQCPLILRSDFDASGIKAEQVIYIGGKPNSTRYSTFKDAASLL